MNAHDKSFAKSKGLSKSAKLNGKNAQKSNQELENAVGLDVNQQPATNHNDQIASNNTHGTKNTGYDSDLLDVDNSAYSPYRAYRDEVVNTVRNVGANPSAQATGSADLNNAAAGYMGNATGYNGTAAGYNGSAAGYNGAGAAYNGGAGYSGGAAGVNYGAGSAGEVNAVVGEQSPLEVGMETAGAAEDMGRPVEGFAWWGLVPLLLGAAGLAWALKGGDNGVSNAVSTVLPALTLANVSAAPITGTTTNAPAGTTVTVVISDQSTTTPDVTATTTVNADGSYTVKPDLSKLHDGQLIATATLTNGTSSVVSATSAGDLELVADTVTVALPAQISATGKSSVQITGSTSDIPVGATVTVVLSDGNSSTADVTAYATVSSNGTYSTTANLANLVAGAITATATAAEYPGELVSGTASSSILNQVVNGNITANVPTTINAANVSAAPITGTTVSAPAGSTVTVVISDIAGHTVTTTATVAVDGTYTAKPNLSSLTDGHLLATASVTDASNTRVTATNSGELEAVADIVTVAVPVISATNQTAVPVSGSTSDIPVGGTVTVVLSDPAGHSVTVKAVVQADHTYATTANLSGLTTGVITAAASASELTGEVITGSNLTYFVPTAAPVYPGGISAIVPAISLANVTAAPVTGSVSNAPAGATVTVVITDQANHTATATATVNTDGSYTVKPNLSGLTDGHLIATATVTDNNGAKVSTTGAGDLEIVPDFVTVSTPSTVASTAKNAVAVTGSTSDIPVGAIVTLALSDSAGHTVTTTSIVQANHTYSTTADLSSFSAGAYGVTASAAEYPGEIVNGFNYGLIKDPIGAATITAAVPTISLANVSATPITGTTSNTTPGATVTVVISDQAPGTPDVTATTTVNTDGTYTVKPNLSPLADGNLVATATVTGTSGSAISSATGVLEVVADVVTVSLPSSISYTGKSAVTLTGTTSDIPVGGTVTVVLADSDSATPNVTVTAVVQSNGTYTTTANLSSLSAGTLTASASAAELTGDIISGNAASTINAPGTANITASIPTISIANVSATPITGTAANTTPGATVTVVISDQAPGTPDVTATTTVNADGTYTVKPDLSHLADGNLVATATVTGTAGTPASSTTTGVLEVIPDYVGVAMASSIPSTATSAVALTGSTSDIPVGGTVTIVVSDTSSHIVTVTAVVQTGGTYSTTANLSALSAGQITATPHASELTGDVITGSPVTSTIGAANHPPTVSGALSSSGTENAPAQTINLIANASDVDGNALNVGAVTYTTSGTGLASGAAITNSTSAPAGVSVNGNSMVIDTSGTAFDSLAAGKTEVITASYTISDGLGGTVTTTSTTTITGVNDAPVITAPTTVNGPANLYPTGSGATAVTTSAIEGTVGLNTTGTGWHIFSYSPDIISGNGTYPNVTGSTYTNTASNIEGTSTNGGTMQSLLSQKVDFGGGAVFTNSEAVSTDFTGLTVGKSYTYTVQWQQDTVTDATKKNANFSGGQLLMQVGHVTYDANGVATLASGSTDKVYTSSGLNDGWQTATITFVADATTESVVLNINGLNGVAADALSSTNYQNGGENGGAIVVDSVGLTAGGTITQGAGASLSSMMPAVTDVDLGSSLKGWAVTSAAADASGGHWEYAPAGSNTWVSLSGASTGAAVFLTPDTQIRWNGASSAHTAFSAVAVDDTSSASEGANINVGTTGGTTPYSANTATLAATAPVVLDLNHDGVISYSHTSLDLNGDGHLVTTPWAGAQDGVLVWDRYQDGQVHDQSQYAFTQYGGATDLAGLKAFDTNGNGSLDAGDALFGQFKVWQDKNGDGKVEAGEMLSLSDLGIKSIALNSDSVSSTPASGVVEFGHAVVSHTDGSTSIAADAMFDHVSVSSKAVTQLVDQTTATMHVV